MFKLLSHNDLDGVSCGLLAKLAFGKEATVRYNSVSGLDREVKWTLEHDNADMFLFITDLSVNEENEAALEAFYQDGGKVMLLDHHKTALHLNAYDWGFVSVEDETGKLHSATSLFYTYLVEEALLEPTAALTEYVELVRQYDTWEWEANDNQKARRLNALFYLLSIEEFEEKMLHRLTVNEAFEFDTLEKEILQMEDAKIARYIRRKRRELVQTKQGELYAGVVYAETYHSELGNQLGKDYPHLDYIAMVNMGSKRIALRTVHEDVDVSVIAEQFAGGGHAKAAGCLLTETAYQKYVAELFPLEPLREDARRTRYNVKDTTHGTLYENRAGDQFFIYPAADSWRIEKNESDFVRTFEAFAEAEKYLKRKEAAWLVRDDAFVRFLLGKIENKA